ncbi:MAG: hypothetical protein QMD71_06405 [bacterium]|nr:hypothetical protein [bacterium]
MARTKTKGVFKIVSKESGKEFFGASSQIEVCFRDYIKWLNNGKHTNKELQSEFDKYGKDNLELVILEELPDADRKTLNQVKKSYEQPEA